MSGLNSNRVRLLLCGLAMLLTATSVFGADKPILEPGGPGVDASAIPEYENSFEVFEEKADGTERLVGTWDDRVEIEQRNGRSVLRRIQQSKTAKGTSAHLDEVDQKTLEPI